MKNQNETPLLDKNEFLSYIGGTLVMTAFLVYVMEFV
ncbi:hypothetical protein IK5_06050 [Bacillus cereus VD154]|uniref:DUF3948 domain-containing protein n=1 Tax=Bacillus cereus VD154 TaxID=1053238 RepID=A0A9W5NZE8_BACCE|nr:hypothetical protein IK5_06050 [Bacillus cereus VD154]